MRIMDTTHIREFIVLAEICNYGKAADALFISQSTLFNHIRALESEIHVPLFEKKGRKIVLSDYGRVFLPYAKTITSASEDFFEVLQDKQEEQSKIIHIATQYRIMDLIKRFRKQNPDYGIHLLDNRDPIVALEEGKCDLAFVRDASPGIRRQYHVIPYLTDSISAAVSADHHLAKRKSITLAELKSEDFVMITESGGRDCHCMSICKAAGFVPKVAMTVINGNEAAKTVSDGMGVSLLLKQTLLSESFDNLVLLDMEPEIKCTISLCWRKNTPLSDGAAKFVKYIQTMENANG